MGSIRGSRIDPTHTDVEFGTFFDLEAVGQVRRAALLLGSDEHANDVVQEALARVYERWETLDHPGSYLNTTVLNLCRAARSEVQFTVDDVMLGRHEVLVLEDAPVRRFRLPRLVVGAVLVMAVGLLATVVLSSSGRTQLDSVPASPGGTTPTSSPTTTAEGVAEPTEPTTVESPIDGTNDLTQIYPAQTSVEDTSEPAPATDPSPIIVTVTSAAPVGDVETTFSGVVAGIEGLTVERVEYDSGDGRCAEIVLTLDSGETEIIGECGREGPEPGRSLSEAAGSPGDVTLADRHFAIFDGKIATDTFASGTRIELDVYGLTTAASGPTAGSSRSWNSTHRSTPRRCSQTRWSGELSPRTGRCSRATRSVEGRHLAGSASQPDDSNTTGAGHEAT